MEGDKKCQEEMERVGFGKRSVRKKINIEKIKSWINWINEIAEEKEKHEFSFVGWGLLPD
ncbi:MAG: hypothetical protein V1649_00100 [Patescibacteria group bacterium]